MSGKAHPEMSDEQFLDWWKRFHGPLHLGRKEPPYCPACVRYEEITQRCELREP